MCNKLPGRGQRNGTKLHESTILQKINYKVLTRDPSEPMTRKVFDHRRSSLVGCYEYSPFWDNMRNSEEKKLNEQ